MLKRSLFFVFLSFLLTACGMLNPVTSGKVNVSFTTEIFVLPGRTVKTGQEVFFTVYPPTERDLYFPNKVYWLFGDEKEAYHDFEDDAWNNMQGASVSHFFNEPGQYKVTAFTTEQMPLEFGDYVWNPEYDESIDQLAKNEIIITVTGEPRRGRFELLMADMNSRISQTVFLRLTDPSISAGYVDVTIRGSGGFRKHLYRSGIRQGDLLQFDLENWLLPADSYELEAKLFTGPGRCVDTIVEFYEKSFSGYPPVGIDKNNNICIDGVPQFIVSATLISAYYGEFDDWAGTYINSTMGEGYVDFYGDNSGRRIDHKPQTFMNYLDRAETYDLLVQGPRVWEGFGERPNGRNSNPFLLSEYVEKCKDKPAMGFWVWIDEPNMGQRRYTTPAPVLRAWYYLSHYYDDNHHPVAVNLINIPYMPRNADGSYWRGMREHFDYIGSGSNFGGRNTFIADIISFDYYPVDDYPRREAGTPVVSNYIEAIHTIQTGAFNLAPVFTCIEITDVFGDDSDAPHPTPEQIEMLSWASIVHNVKGINWFPYFARPLEENMAMVNRILTWITDLHGPILAKDVTGLSGDDADDPGRRVDIKMTETGDAYWLFAVRITEPFEMTGAPADVTFSLNVPVGDVTVFGEDRTITSVGNEFTDRFDDCAVHIYRIDK